MNLQTLILKLLCPVGEKNRREYRKEVHRMLATAEDLTRTLRKPNDTVRQG